MEVELVPVRIAKKLCDGSTFANLIGRMPDRDGFRPQHSHCDEFDPLRGTRKSLRDRAPL